MVATERRRARVRKQREDWIKHRLPAVSAQPDRVVFIPSRDIRFANALPVIDGEAFAAYISQVLVPELEPGTVVVLDNLATHKNADAAKAMRKAGCWFLFLPTYSPDLNPIEMAFSKPKAHLRRIGARTFTEMFNALSETCDLYSQDECWHYFKAAGYVSG